ncbi:hypothetical protein IH575_00060 [Candidatus Dojkabacteria bacterium]|nr:hypothetical protein [Candidatus Dojkabacteria bacterium]
MKYHEALDLLARTAKVIELGLREGEDGMGGLPDAIVHIDDCDENPEGEVCLQLIIEATILATRFRFRKEVWNKTYESMDPLLFQERAAEVFKEGLRSLSELVEILNGSIRPEAVWN